MSGAELSRLLRANASCPALMTALPSRDCQVVYSIGLLESDGPVRFVDYQYRRR